MTSVILTEEQGVQEINEQAKPTPHIYLLNNATQTEVNVETFLRQPVLLSPKQTCEEAYNYFHNESDECAVICEDGQIPIGLIMKDWFFRQMGTMFGPSLFFRKSVTRVMDRSPLILERTTPIQRIIDLALGRSEQYLYDCIIITDNHRLLGILTCSDLLALSRILQRQTTETHIHSVHNTSQMISRIHLAVREVCKSTETGLRLSKAMIDKTLDGKLALQKVVSTFERLNILVDRQERQIRELEQQSQTIRSFVASIRELAEQTNVLSINASIEAARAGVDGKGFAVVAEEVRKLAAGTKLYSEEVRQVTNQISEAVVQAVATAESGKEETMGSMIHIKDTAGVFEQLFTLISENTTSTQQIHHYTEVAEREGTLVHNSIQTLIEDLEKTNKTAYKTNRSEG